MVRILDAVESVAFRRADGGGMRVIDAFAMNIFVVVVVCVGVYLFQDHLTPSFLEKKIYTMASLSIYGVVGVCI